MDGAKISRTLSLIPERVLRTASGSLLPSAAASCRYPERLAHLLPLLDWLTPLNAITSEDQRALGLIGANGRMLHAGEEEDDEPLPAEDPGGLAADSGAPAADSGTPAVRAGSRFALPDS